MNGSDGSRRRFARYAWGVVGYDVLVILWGAWVRITGSGAGCGAHWPTCDGEVVPRSLDAEKAIEFAHRATSGLALLLTVGLVVWAFRAFPPGHRVRWGAVGAAGFILAEALLGAGLVLFGLVADDDSVARAVVISLHQVNTLALLGFGALTAAWAGGAPAPRWRAPGRGPALLALAGLALIGMAGAVTALGDTLFPLDPAAGGGPWQGLRAAASPDAHFLVQLRLVHPVLAMLVAVYLVALAARALDAEPPALRRAARAVTALVLTQVAAGWATIVFAAPGGLQIVHLLLADLVWIAAVLMVNAKLAPARGAG